ncbi:uncharacterized protein V1513DRAFT_436018 [Lipomyces chichibuensis]|uniref:uncharacterized protein n=1 Tax=Lipomyces chichibuensis TaxID=1546026 RepID=UPI003343A699
MNIPISQYPSFTRRITASSISKMNNNSVPRHSISATSSSTSLSSAMSHTLTTPNTSDPPTPYFYPTSAAKCPSGLTDTEYPSLRTPLPSPTGSPAPEAVFARMLRNRRLTQIQQGKHTDNVDDDDDTLLEITQQQVSPWEDFRQSWLSPSPSGAHTANNDDRWTMHEEPEYYPQHSHSHITTAATEDELSYEQEYTLRPPPAPNFGTDPGLQVDILAEAAKRAEMEILATDISEMQF